jgi:RNA polymerase sigma factor (sigma-70 family)
MTTSDDMELLREYASQNSETAFAMLVSRHIDMVYSVSWRRTGNHHQSEEITQTVFVLLARKAGSLRPGTVLSGWLFHTARLTAANFIRTEIRRTRREQEAFMQANAEENQTAVWERIAPLLDDAIAALGEKDRDAVVLRFVKGKDYPEVGKALGTTPEAAQVRVSRAVEKLRKIFGKRGVALSGAALGGAISANSVQAAPAGLAVAITSAAVQGTALTASTLTLAKGTLSVMAWAKIAFGVGVVVLLTYQWQENSSQARQIESTRENLTRTDAEIEQQAADISERRRENFAMADEIRGQERDLQRLRADRQTALNNAGAAARVRGAGGQRSPINVLAAQLDDPVAREALRQSLLNTASNRYSGMLQELKLSADVAEKFYSIYADAGMSNLDTAAAASLGKMSQTQAEARTADLLGPIRELLGDEGFSAYKTRTADIPGRTLVNQLQSRLTENQLTEDQTQRLLAVIRSEPYESTSALAGDYDLPSIVSPEELEKRYQRQAEVTQHILDRAADFLTPDQLGALGMMNTNIMDSQRLVGARAFKKF